MPLMCSDKSSLLPLHELEADDGPASPQPEFSFGTPSAVKGNIPLTSLAGLDKVYHPSPSQSKNSGLNLLQKIDQHDPHAKARDNFDVHYPFVDHSEWQLVHWLASAPLPQSATWESGPLLCMAGYSSLCELFFIMSKFDFDRVDPLEPNFLVLDNNDIE